MGSQGQRFPVSIRRRKQNELPATTIEIRGILLSQVSEVFPLIDSRGTSEIPRTNGEVNGLGLEGTTAKIRPIPGILALSVVLAGPAFQPGLQGSQWNQTSQSIELQDGEMRLWMSGQRALKGKVYRRGPNPVPRRGINRGEIMLSSHPLNPSQRYLPWQRKLKIQLNELLAIHKPDIRTLGEIYRIQKRLQPARKQSTIQS